MLRCIARPHLALLPAGTPLPVTAPDSAHAQRRHVRLSRSTWPPQVDYVRVYQPAAAINIGCSPKEYPTEQYLAW